MSEPLLICTDLDGTLLPDGRAPESPTARPRFARVVARSEVTLAFVTGRHRGLVEEAITEFALPRPDLVIGDVGTTVYRVVDGEWLPVPGWSDRLAAEWPEGAHARLRGLLADLAELELQESSKQAEFKLSYYLASPVESDEILAEVGRRLERRGLPVRSILSHDAQGVGLLDLVPRAAGKLAAVEFLLERGPFSRDRTVFAGDSGNDLEALIGDLPAVLVANAGEEVRGQARAGAAAGGHEGRLYLARGGFLGMNGNYAAGILEGLAHFVPEATGWM